MTGISCLGCLGMGQAPTENYIEAQSVCGVYGAYTDPTTGSVYQMNGGCTDPQTANLVIATPTNTTNESTFLASFNFTDWWNALSQTEQLLLVGGVGVVGWQWIKGKGQRSRRGLQ